LAKPKPIVGINCDESARVGIVLGLKTRFDEMFALREAALDFSSPAGVHDMRVASRRLRGTLSAFQPYLKAAQLGGCLAEIKTIASALGGVRDHDVAIITLTETAAEAPDDIAAGIRQFADLRREKQEEARVELTTALDAEAMLALMRKFTESLDGDNSQLRAGQKRSAPLRVYRDVAAEIILKRLNDLEASSDSLYRPLKTKRLHALRIKGKQLRYALQLFEPCWGSPLAVPANKIAGLQSALGKLHDCDVWLRDIGRTATSGSDLGFDYRSTVVWLLRHFAKLRSKHFGDALLHWHEWETEELSARLRQLMQSDNQDGETTGG
jgi:CHAD domain-containing protein